MKRYGLVFKIDEECWLAEYVDEEIQDASVIDDHNGVYTDLNPKEMSLVCIETVEDVENGERVYLDDLKTITVQNKENSNLTVMDLVSSGDFSKLAKYIFESEIP